MYVDLYTDGSCRNGHGGWAWVSRINGKYSCSESGREEKTTHQRMEILAVIKGLEYYKGAEITVFSDSAYVVNCMNDRWYENWVRNGWMSARGREIKNMDLWERLLSLINEHIKFVHVRGHQTNDSVHAKFNNMADKLAKR